MRCTAASPRPEPSFFVVKKGRKVLKGDFNDVAFASTSIDVTRPGRDGQLSTVRHGIKRIRGEIPKHLPHLVLVHLGGEGTPGQ